MINFIDCQMLAILVLVGLLISRFQVQVLVGAHLPHLFSIGANWRNHFSCNSDSILMMILAHYWRINLVELWWIKLHSISYVLTSANTS